MTQSQNPNNDLPWQIAGKIAYFPLFHEGALVGFCRREYVAGIINKLNDEPKLRKALEMACSDLVANYPGDKRKKIEELIQKYLLLADRPRYGSRAIAAMLRERQIELNVSDPEFYRFCESYRLSVQELQEIYGGEEVINSQLVPLSRILGVPVEELVEVRDGPKKI